MYYINEKLELGGNIEYLYSKNPEFQNFMMFCGWMANVNPRLEVLAHILQHSAEMKFDTSAPYNSL